MPKPQPRPPSTFNAVDWLQERVAALDREKESLVIYLSYCEQARGALNEHNRPGSRQRHEPTGQQNQDHERDNDLKESLEQYFSYCEQARWALSPHNRPDGPQRRERTGRQNQDHGQDEHLQEQPYYESEPRYQDQGGYLQAQQAVRAKFERGFNPLKLDRGIRNERTLLLSNALALPISTASARLEEIEGLLDRLWVWYRAAHVAEVVPKKEDKESKLEK